MYTEVTIKPGTRGCHRQRGFTLIELITVMVVTGAMLALASSFIVSPFRIAGDVDRRAQLVDATQTAALRLSREVRRALPNSIRPFAPDANGRSTAIELLLTRDGGRYRRQVDTGGGAPGDPLDLTEVSGQFEVLGGLAAAAEVASAGNCLLGSGDCLVIYNTDYLDPASPTNAYGGLNLADITAASATSLDYADAGGGLGFPLHSPNQRFFVVQGAVTYRCSGDELRRHSAYPIQSVQTVAIGTIGPGQVLIDGLNACEFRYRPGDASRNGLLSIRLGVSQDGETVTLLRQVHVVNSP